MILYNHLTLITRKTKTITSFLQQLLKEEHESEVPVVLVVVRLHDCQENLSLLEKPKGGVVVKREKSSPPQDGHSNF